MSIDVHQFGQRADSSIVYNLHFQAWNTRMFGGPHWDAWFWPHNLPRQPIDFGPFFGGLFEQMNSSYWVNDIILWISEKNWTVCSIRRGKQVS